MFILHSSNKTENLVEHLAAVLAHAPLSSPFGQELFLIQSQGMERWLSQQLAGRFQVWANYRFLFPSKFFGYIAQLIDSRIDDSAFDRNLLLWRLESMLRRLDDVSLQPLKHYLDGANPDLKRYQLAHHLAQLFDQYQIMRPELLAAWQENRLLHIGEAERWQRTLWNNLCRTIGSQHRGALWLNAIAKLNNAEPDAFANRLPERISIFGINTMPPLFLNYLQSLSRHCDIHLYLLNPAQTYWADLVSKRKSIEDNIEPAGHPLLASLGQQGREFQAMLLDVAQFDFEPESFESAPSANNLQHLQNDILNNSLTGQPLLKDSSIGIHACHSRKREIEVLRDQLLFALEHDPNLELRDIAVMAPDIEIYEPFISALFNDIPHAVADRGLRLENRILDLFIRFLEAARSRLGWKTVLDLLENPAVYGNFGLNPTDLDLIKHWIADTNVRWGESGKHKQELGLPQLNEFTWQAALDRLLMGYAVGDDAAFIDGILPYPHIEGKSAEALGGLHDFLKVMFRAKSVLDKARPLKDWGKNLYALADEVFGQQETQDSFAERQQLNDLLLELSELLSTVHSDPVDVQVILLWLQSAVAEHKSSNGFLRGRLTFCSILPMRSIPFKVIALLGINEGEFPKIDRQPTFDLISRHYRPGDRSRRADDRYQFLELLLSARRQLIITYIGQSQTANTAMPPSVAVTELLDVLRDYYHLDDLVTLHPLQPFSRCYFDGGGLISYSQADSAIARTLASPKIEPSIWWQGRLETPDESPREIVELDDFFRFFQHPQRYFFRRQLNLQLSGMMAETQECEPFSAGELNLYGIQQSWLAHILAGEPFSLKKLQAQGAWPPGAIGELEFDDQEQPLRIFAETIQALNLGQPLDGRPMDLAIGPNRLIGKLGNLYQNGGLFFRYAALKGKDFLTAWLHHLIANRLAPQETYLIGTDDSLLFTPDMAHADLLPQFFEIYREGQQRPDVFFTEAALTFVKYAANPKAKKSPSEAAADSLAEAIAYVSEHELRQLFGNIADMNSIITAELTARCEQLLVPAWLSAHDR